MSSVASSPVKRNTPRSTTKTNPKPYKAPSGSEDDQEKGSSPPPRKLLSRGAKRKSIVDTQTSDEEEDEDARPARGENAKGKGRASTSSTKPAPKKKKVVEDSDEEYESADHMSAEDDDDEEHVPSEGEEDESAGEEELSDSSSVAEMTPPPKSKGKGRAMVVAQRSPSPVREVKRVKPRTAEEMEEDELDALHPNDGSPIVLIYSDVSRPSLPTNFVPAYPPRIHRDRKKEKAARTKLAAARKKANKDKMVASDAEEGDDDEGEAVPDNEDAVAKSARLPPLFKIEDIFADLTKNAKGLEDFAREMMESGEKLKVATMCSGTESPLLALSLISRALKAQTGVELKIDHGFSCEIEPYKQAYIERNFAPPILFADVTELGDLTAHNAYGAKIPVPTEGYTMLIAGTSCVDFSNLNKTKKEMAAKGESGRTWAGMLAWVKKARPWIVILENVVGAPWDQMVDDFEDIGYAAESTRFDTKNYYIPHTRTRGYQVCFRKPDWDPWFPNAKSITDPYPAAWETMVKSMQRPSSAPLEAFLLPSDDPRIHQARLDLSKKTLLALDEKSRAPSDWARCQSRHERCRHEERLGDKRPATCWSEAGPPQPKDGAWMDWAVSQTERVLDLCDVNTIRKAAQDFDAFYKNFVWNLSQNVDRETGSSRTAISPCLTPNMIPYVTNRGGPVVGLEALSLQGLPIEALLLTRETEDQLASLAGNAMSSTVVGTAMLAALIVGRPMFQVEWKKRALERAQIMDIDDEPAEEDDLPALVDANIKGVEKLVSGPLDLSASVAIPIKKLLEDGTRSSRHCDCEGRSDTAISTILRCQACGHRACKTCAGRPEHEYEDSKISSDRLSPLEFGDELKKMVPTRLSFEGVNEETLEDARSKGVELGVVLLDRDWRLFKNSFVAALGPAEEYRYTWIKRRDIWSIRMESSKSWLQLDLDPVSPTWFLFLRAEASDGGLSRRRILLQPPAARLQLDKTSSSVFAGKWEVSLPSTSTFKISIQGRGEKIASWKNTLGLVDYQKQLVYREIDVSVPEESLELLDQDISGRYYLNPDCGTAQDSLFIRPASEGKKAISFFLDPTRSGPVEEDGFVFASRSDRLAYGEYRTIIAKIDCAWRPPIQDPEVSPEVDCTVLGTWVVAPSVSLEALKVAVPGESPAGSLVPAATISLPPPALDFDFAPDACVSSTAILTVSVNIAHPELEPPLWREGEWNQIDLRLKAKDFSETTAWIMERLPELKSFEKWSSVEYASIVEEDEEATTCCERCAPAPPMIMWQMSKAKKLLPMEDPVEAGKFEQALKHRPAPFVVQARLDGNLGTIRLGLNVVSLLHKALSVLPPSKSTFTPTLSWRLTPNHPSVESTIYISKKFVMRSNKLDPTAPQPPSFKKFPLRPEQLRSFGWAMRQERPAAEFTFEEEEISEALLAPLEWRAEGKASRKVLVRGGVIADAVGYGKTAICLGLIDASSKLEPLESLAPSSKEFIYSKATLVVVPGHLAKQWESEAKKFLQKGYKVKLFMSFTDLRKFTIKDYQEADIIIICTNLFNSPPFWESLAAFSAVGTLPKAKEPTRYWMDRLQECLAGARAQVEILNESASAGTSKGVRKVLANIDAAFVEEERMFKEAMERGEVRIGRKKFDKALVEAQYIGKKTKGKTAAQLSKDDLFGLNTAAVRLDWTQTKCAPIHAIMFERVVVDEFTYVEGKARSAIKALNSHATWVLSGTPNVQTFDEINEIADLLHVHLGVPDDLNRNSSKSNDNTSAELFHSFREVHSQEWRAHRDDVGQRFLDAFVRQNVAEIGEIPLTTHVVRIHLPAAEKALYLELEHHLNTMNESGIQISKSAFKKIKTTTAKSVADRIHRLAQVLDNAKDLRETLIRRCSGFQPPDLPAVAVSSLEDEYDEDGEIIKKKKATTKMVIVKAAQSATADETCERIVAARGEQLDLCKEDLRLSLKLAVYHYRTIDWSGEEQPSLVDFVKNSFRSEQNCEGDRDPDATKILQEYLVEFGCDATGKIGKKPELTKDELELRSGTQSWLKTISKGKTQADTAKQTKERAAIWDLRERNHVLRGLDKELRSRNRSLRFFNAVRQVQLTGANEDFKCPNVNCTSEDTVEVISSSCGHSACSTCMERQARAGLKCPIQGCKNTLGPPHLLPVSTLLKSVGGDSGKYGAKMEELLRIVREEATPKKEKVLVFAQFSLVDTIQDALKAENIKCTVIKGSAWTQSKAVQDFQENTEGETTVLVLNTSDASAAGANLTQANHAIFFHPIHVETKHKYVSTDTQAVGRLQRYGQKKMVHIWRLGAVDTVDEAIWSERGFDFEKASLVEEKVEKDAELEEAVAAAQEGDDDDMMEEEEVVDQPAQGLEVEVDEMEEEEVPVVAEEEVEIAPAEAVDSPMVEDKSEVPSPSVEDFEEPLPVVESVEVEAAMVVEEEKEGGDEVVVAEEEEELVVPAAAAAAPEVAKSASQVDVDALLEGVCAEDFDDAMEEDF